MSNIVAGVGRGQLLHLDEHCALKEKIYRRYEEAFKGLPVKMNPYLPDSKPNFWLSCMIIDEDCKKDPIDLIKKLAEEKSDGKFYGIHTVYKICSELLFYKATTAAESNSAGRIIHKIPRVCNSLFSACVFSANILMGRKAKRLAHCAIFCSTPPTSTSKGMVTVPPPIPIPAGIPPKNPNNRYK